MEIEGKGEAGLGSQLSRRKFLSKGAVVGAGVVTLGALGAAACSGSDSGQKATPASAAVGQQTTTRSILLTMWGMKPYALPAGETAPSITADGKWTNVPIGPPGATFATVHHFVPHTFIVNKGDTVRLTVLNLGLHHHGFAIPEYGIDFMAGGPNIVGERGGPSDGTLRGTVTGGPDARTVTFVADKTGAIEFMCNLPYDKDLFHCNPLHEFIHGQLLVLG